MALQPSAAYLVQRRRRLSSCPEEMEAMLSVEFPRGADLTSPADAGRPAGWSLFSAPEGAVSSDPVVDLVRQSPAAAARYLRIMMQLGGFGGVIVCIACLGYLLQFWECSGCCDRPLRWWLLAHSVLQLLQIPVRFAFLAKLQGASADGSNLEARITSFTASLAWRASKNISLATYGCFVLGITWLINAGKCSGCPGVYWMTVFVIAQAFARAVAAMLLCRIIFPQSELDADTAPKGASTQQIESLQMVPFAPGLFDELDASCAVCLSEYCTGEALRVLPCGHHFHCQCADEWLHRSSQCPLCRQDIDTGASASATTA